MKSLTQNACFSPLTPNTPVEVALQAAKAIFILIYY